MRHSERKKRYDDDDIQRRVRIESNPFHTREIKLEQKSFLPAFASSSASPNRKAGAEMPFPLPFATIATAPHAATPATASAIVFRDDAPLNKGGGFFSSAVFWVLCNNKGASSAREDEIAPYTFILTEGGGVTQLLLTLVVCLWRPRFRRRCVF